PILAAPGRDHGERTRGECLLEQTQASTTVSRSATISRRPGTRRGPKRRLKLAYRSLTRSLDRPAGAVTGESSGRGPWRPSNQSHTALFSRSITVHYPWHPFCGQTLTATRTHGATTSDRAFVCV